MTETDRYLQEVEDWLDGGLGGAYGMPWQLPQGIDLDEFLKEYRRQEAIQEAWEDGYWVEGEEVPDECYEG